MTEQGRKHSYVKGRQQIKSLEVLCEIALKRARIQFEHP